MSGPSIARLAAPEEEPRSASGPPTSMLLDAWRSWRSATHVGPRPHSSFADYLEARRLLAELGYPETSEKARLFWHGFRARARGETAASCPVPDVRPIDRERGRRTPYTRTAWLNGFRVGDALRRAS